MPTFQEKPIEAFQVTPESMEDKDNWPEWLTEAWEKEPSEGGSFHESGGGLILVHCPNLGYVPVEYTDWVVREHNETFSKLKDEDFNERYEPVSAAPAKKKTQKQSQKEKPKEAPQEKSE